MATLTQFDTLEEIHEELQRTVSDMKTDPQFRGDSLKIFESLVDNLRDFIEEFRPTYYELNEEMCDAWIWGWRKTLLRIKLLKRK